MTAPLPIFGWPIERKIKKAQFLVPFVLLAPAYLSEAQASDFL
jgi:hypothetical protein